VRLREGSVIKMADVEDVELDNLFSGPQAFDYGTGIPAYVLYLLMNNTWTQPRVAGVNLMLEYSTEPRNAQIRRVSLDRYRVRAGEQVEATIVVAPYRGPEQIYTRKIEIPEDTPAGPLTLQVGGAVAVDREDARREPVMPRDLEQLVGLINQLRRNYRVYIAANREDAGVLLEGSRLPNLPPSVTHVLTRPETHGNVTLVRQRTVLEESIETPFAVEGAARIELDVEAR
jgi:hypothetical protein